MAAAAPAWMALSWDIPPQNGHDVYFSRDLYEKYSLAPTLSELMSLSKRNQGSENTAATSHWGPEKQQQPSQEIPGKTEPSVAPPQEPRVPYPYVSSLSEKEQRRYLFLLSQYLKADPNLLPWSQQRNYTQYLQMKEFVSKEVAEFLKFAQNAARSCAKDYSDISDDALLYTKDFLSARMSCVKNYPERYSLHEVTSLMGGRFSRELTLKFEKSLLALGMVHLVKRFFPKLPASINLPADKAKHEQLCGTPEHRAAQLHNDISTDPNAEQLAAKYCPQVVLTGESLYTLLNNHGLDYKQQWELPVSVKTVSLAGMLWDAVEEAADYEPPQQGNLVYKLYSLDGMLLLVRTSIQKVELRPHQKKAKFRRHFPVYVLPKLEYQAFYGAETLTEDEVCRLWMESLLHSNTSFTVGHVDALTSQLFLLERLTGKALKRRFGTFNPTNSLHILQNILKKVAGLQEGSFLLTHLAGDSSASIYKSSDGITTRAMYNLHAAHADLPPTPAALSVPWVPLDPNVPLPHHFAQGRIPCTFPPRPDEGARNAKMSRKAKAFPGTPSRQGPISTGSRDGSLQAEPPRKKHGAAQDKGSRPANQGPNRKFWKKKKCPS
uniref:Interactor of little elongation complex ELL subunit 2 n=1 Tax=Naja naja TaxID=35670 RepID=A0A8C6X2W9_NAJNA